MPIAMPSGRALDVLDQGAVVGLFPEGHRQRGGNFGHINPGVALFSLREGVVTIPVVLEGTDRVMKGRLLHLPRVRVTFGPPLRIPPTNLTKAERSKDVSQRLTRAFCELSAPNPLGRRGFVKVWRSESRNPPASAGEWRGPWRWRGAPPPTRGDP